MSLQFEVCRFIKHAKCTENSLSNVKKIIFLKKTREKAKTVLKIIFSTGWGHETFVFTHTFGNEECKGK